MEYMTVNMSMDEIIVELIDENDVSQALKEMLEDASERATKDEIHEFQDWVDGQTPRDVIAKMSISPVSNFFPSLNKTWNNYGNE